MHHQNPLVPLSLNRNNPVAPAVDDPCPAAGATSAARNPRYQDAIRRNFTKLNVSAFMTSNSDEALLEPLPIPPPLLAPHLRQGKWHPFMYV